MKLYKAKFRISLIVRNAVCCIVFFVIAACSKQTETLPQVVDSRYMPVAIGRQTEYYQTFIQIDIPAGINDTAYWIYRETIDTILSDSLNYVTYRVLGERKKLETDAWVPYSVSQIRIAFNEVVRTDNNISLVTLKYPIEYKKIWDGNIYSILGYQKFQYTQTFINHTIEPNEFDSVIVVTHNNLKSIYDYNFKEERYAPNFGMISKTIYNVESQPNHASIDISKPIEQRITKGTIELWKIKLD